MHLVGQLDAVGFLSAAEKDFGTADDVTEAYRAAFQRMVKDPDFIERGKKISEDLSPMSHLDMEKFIGQMAGVTEETETFIKNLLRKQGLRIEG